MSKVQENEVVSKVDEEKVVKGEEEDVELASEEEDDVPCVKIATLSIDEEQLDKEEEDEVANEEEEDDKPAKELASLCAKIATLSSDEEQFYFVMFAISELSKRKTEPSNRIKAKTKYRVYAFRIPGICVKLNENEYSVVKIGVRCPQTSRYNYKCRFKKQHDPKCFITQRDLDDQNEHVFFLMQEWNVMPYDMKEFWMDMVFERRNSSTKAFGFSELLLLKEFDTLQKKLPTSILNLKLKKSISVT